MSLQENNDQTKTEIGASDIVSSEGRETESSEEEVHDVSKELKSETSDVNAETQINKSEIPKSETAMEVTGRTTERI